MASLIIVECFIPLSTTKSQYHNIIIEQNYQDTPSYTPSLLIVLSAETSSYSDSRSLKLKHQGPITDTPYAGQLEGLFQQAWKTCQPMAAENTEGAHDAFRFEWGRWVDDASMEALMERVNEIQLCPGAYDTFINDEKESGDDDSMATSSRRLRVAGGEHWDCILHILPPDTEWSGRWPTGAWAIVRSLTGVAEVAMLRGPNRDGLYTKATKKALRGGGDGTLSGGTAGGGEDCVKYVGGALRSYSGKSGKTSLLEVVVRPPIGKGTLDGDGQDSATMQHLENPENFLKVVIPGLDTEEGGDEMESDDAEEESDNSIAGPSHLGTKLGMSFEKIGGLDDQLDAIVRRVLASR